MSSQDGSSFSHVDEMCSRIMKLLVHHIPLDKGERVAYKKVDVWDKSRSINGTDTAGPYEPGLKDPSLKDAVFKKLTDRKDIEDLGDRMRITEHGAAEPKNQDPHGVYSHGHRYLYA